MEYMEGYNRQLEILLLRAVEGDAWAEEQLATLGLTNLADGLYDYARQVFNSKNRENYRMMIQAAERGSIDAMRFLAEGHYGKTVYRPSKPDVEVQKWRERLAAAERLQEMPPQSGDKYAVEQDIR